ncbi:hypothetical protein LTR53_001014 [Teratosphaeriaceae sp. CCFEE 6253]|nr:hypothetical protein LTR53_001014 [Teratosphaeriaceae sp. CCFEE 6253]
MGEPSSQSQWAHFSQTLAAAIKDGFYYSQHAYMAEARVMRALAKARAQSGPGRSRRCFVRSYENSPADLCIVRILDESLIAPPSDATDHAFWDWARKHQGPGLSSIPVDVKLMSLHLGQKIQGDRSRYYQWSKSLFKHRMTQTYDVVFIVVDGLADYIAVVPAQLWRAYADHSGGIETMSGRAPLWTILFLVHLDQFGEAIDALTAAAEHPGIWYINPTTRVVFRGWTPGSSSDLPITPVCTEPRVMASYVSVVKLWDEILDAELGCRIYFNPLQPLVHDFYIWVPGAGLLRVEHKRSADKLATTIYTGDDRRAPLVERRTWHVFYAQCADGTLCFTRDELEKALVDVNGKKRLDPRFVRKRTVRDFSEAVKYIQRHAARAKQAAAAAFHYVRPEDLTRGLDVEHWNGRVAEMLARDASRNPLLSLLGTRGLLPDISIILNENCCKMGYGAWFALASGHAIATHLFVAYEWSQRDREDFREHGELPFYLFSPGVWQMRCLAIRIQDHVLSPGTKPRHLPVSIRRAHWKKPADANVRHFILGAILDGSRVDLRDERSSWVLLLPSEFTAMWSGEDRLRKCDLAAGTDGTHMQRHSNAEHTRLADPPWQHSSSQASIGKYMADSDVNVMRYVLNLADGTVHRQLRAVLEAKGPHRILNPQSARPEMNREFDARPYHATVGEIHQAGYDYGCE